MTLIRDRYEPLAIVGCGGQGEVIKARDTLHDRTVALKVRRLASSIEQQGLLSEAKVLRDLMAHAGVTQVREDFFEDGRYYLVMEWVDGTPLDQLIERDGPLPLADAARYLRQVAEALDHLHTHDPPVIHGDVKPANIVVRADGRAVLVDFGIAARVDAGGAAGTTGFRAPELRWGSELSAATDVYGLAATAFTILTGRAPGPGEAPDWSALADDAPRLEHAMRRGLAYDPSRRPRASAFVDALVPPPAPNNLPAALTRFVGREREIEQVRSALGTTRLLTLVGVGGSGKTRLAIEAATEAIGAFPNGVWLIDLSPLRQDDLVPQAFARATGAREAPGRDLIETVAAGIGSGVVLIVLDNCEHVLDGCARAVASLLAACPRLTVLATSREPLDMLGEVIFNVPALSTPEADALEEVERSEAGRLFIDRARTASRDWRPDVRHEKSIAAITRRLDGIPLAIELAAARMRSESPDQILAALDRRFDALAAGNRGALPRQQTLRATMDWSYDLLDDNARAVLRRLGVFAGGFTDEAAYAVCGVEVTDELRVLEHHSLIARDHAAGRYRILETVREYGAERLAETGESDDARDRHVRWVKAFAARVGPDLTGQRQASALEATDLDYANVRAALDRLAERTDAQGTYEIVADIGQYFWIKGQWSDVLERIARARAWADQRPSAARSNALFVAGWLSTSVGAPGEARALFDDALATARACGDKKAERRALGGYAQLALDSGDFAEVERLQLDALRVARELGDTRGVVLALTALGGNAYTQSHTTDAEPWLEEAVTLARSLDEPDLLSSALDGLGMVRRQQRRYEEAIALTDEAVLLRLIRGERSAIAVMKRGNLALMVECDPESALAYHKESLERARAIGARPVVVLQLANAAQAAAAAGHLQEASALYEQAIEGFREQASGGLSLVLARAAAVAERKGDEPRARELLKEALDVRENSPEFFFPLVQEAAEMATARDRIDLAAQLLGFLSTGSEPEPFDKLVQDALAERARAALGDSFEAAFNEGKACRQASMADRIRDLT